MMVSTHEQTRPRREPAEHLAAVIAVQQEIATAELDLEHTMSLVTRRSMELTHAGGGVVEMLEGEDMVYRAVAGSAEPHAGFRLRARASLSGLCVAQREVLRSDDTDEDPRVDRAACRRIGIRSMIVVPLMFKDRAIGVLKVTSSQPGWFHAEDASTLQLMAGLIAAAVAHAQAFEAQARAERLRTTQLESLLANAPFGIAFFDREHRYVRVNRALAEANGRAVEDHLGRTITEILGEQGRTAGDLVDAVFRSRAPEHAELSAEVAPGDERHWLVGMFPLFEDEGDLQLVGSYVVDMTERKRNERELQRTNALVNAIITASSDGIYLKDRESRLQFLNPAVLQLIDRPLEQVLGKNDVEFLGPQAQSILDTDRRIMEQGEPETVEEMVTVGGTTHVFLSSKSPYRGPDGEVIGLIGVSKDITHRKRGEQQLRAALDILEQHRAQLEAVFQAVKDGIMVFDRDGRVMLLNESEAQICGYASAAEMRRDLDYFASVFELAEIGGPVISVADWPVSRVLAGESIRDRQLHARRRDTGQEWFFSFSGEPVRDESGNLRMGVLITRDITAYKNAELSIREGAERFRTLADNITQLAWMADERGNVFWYNKRWYDFTGTSGDVIPQWGWPEAQHGDHAERVVAKLERCFASGEFWEDTFPLRAADGTYRWFLSRAMPIRDAEGRVIRWFGTHTDVTDQREIEQRLREAIRARDEFVSVASHELKTPLTSLQLQVEALRRSLLRAEEARARGESLGIPEERIRKFAEQTGRQTARLGQLVDDMLDISRIASGKFGVEREAMDLTATVNEVVDRLRPQLEAANGGVAVRAPEPVRGLWDRHRIEQVLSNLLTNAMRYGKGAPIEVSLERRGDVAHLAVTDRGMGIAPENLGRIFDRFERAISANEVSGLGLGLFISRQIVEAHNGRIWAESTLGKGASFHVELPI